MLKAVRKIGKLNRVSMAIICTDGNLFNQGK